MTKKPRFSILIGCICTFAHVTVASVDRRPANLRPVGSSCVDVVSSAAEKLQSAPDIDFDELILKLKEETPEKKSRLATVSRFVDTDRDGRVVRVYDRDLQTYVSFGSTIPQTTDEITPNLKARGVIIFAPGAGTENEGGHVFNYKANALTRMGFDTVSFDYPWDSIWERRNSLVLLLQKVIKKYSRDGVPVTLVGHSFGANLILEALHVLGGDLEKLNGIVVFSPIGTDEGTTRDWVDGYATKLLDKRGIVVKKNEKRSKRVGTEVSGSTEVRSWADMSFRDASPGFLSQYGDALNNIRYDVHNPGFATMTRQFASGLPASTSIEVANPKFRLVIGEDDEFLPRLNENRKLDIDGTTIHWDGIFNFKKKFPSLTIVSKPGVGHGVFKVKEEDGRDLVIKEILEGAGYNYAR